MSNTTCQTECSCSQLNNLAIMGYSRKKSKQGRLRAYVLVGKTPGTLISLLLYPWKPWTKQSLTPENFTKLCYKNMLHPLMMIYRQTNHYVAVTWYKLLFCTSDSIVSNFLWSTWYLTTPKFQEITTGSPTFACFYWLNVFQWTTRFRTYYFADTGRTTVYHVTAM